MVHEGLARDILDHESEKLPSCEVRVDANLFGLRAGFEALHRLLADRRGKREELRSRVAPEPRRVAQQLLNGERRQRRVQRPVHDVAKFVIERKLTFVDESPDGEGDQRLAGAVDREDAVPPDRALQAVDTVSVGEDNGAAEDGDGLIPRAPPPS